MIKREKLALLEYAYSINLIEIDGVEYCITASEARSGDILLISTGDGGIQKITGLKGGVMSIIPIPEENGGFLAIQRFYPIFNSAQAELVHCRIVQAGEPELTAEVETVFELPYIHRFALMGHAGARKIIAGALCGGKAFQDDWSKPGFVNCYSLDSHFKPVQCTRLIDSISRNHGMFIRPDGTCMVSGDEGVWAIDAEMRVTKLLDMPVSDLFMYDLDGDGADEMVCISPFHGDRLSVLKEQSGNWTELCGCGINFGHSVYAGVCGGPFVLSCSRAGDKRTDIWSFTCDSGRYALESSEFTSGVGAANIVVKSVGKSIVFYAADHGCGEVARYTVTR